MKTYNATISQKKIVTLLAAVLLCIRPGMTYGDIEFAGGVTAQIDYTVDGAVWIYDANVIMVEPAHILEFVATGSGAVFDIYGGQIDQMLLISTSDDTLPEGQVTVYGTDFAIDGVPVDPETTELFLQGQMLSGVYENGTPFAFSVECFIMGGGGYSYYQTVKLGWVVSEPDIEVSQYDYDFGQTDIETTQYGTLTVYNLGNAALTIQSLQLEQDENLQFEFTPLQVMPLTLAPNTALDIEISYNPVLEGYAQATFRLTSDDPNDPVVEVALSGEGIPVVLSSQEQAVQILDTYDWAVENDLIEGVGKKKSAKNKLRVFGKMLTIADDLIAGGYNEQALEVLLMVEKKCDGQKRPKDFIKGPAAADINALINELINALQTQ
ncbi:MAG: choice-of-anchor D domain-containing protein [Phycisphaerae bacterium]|nr:choice-of-anchor D domain-containing protein [Phycisphaerae bacterium]